MPSGLKASASISGELVGPWQMLAGRRLRRSQTMILPPVSPEARSQPLPGTLVPACLTGSRPRARQFIVSPPSLQGSKRVPRWAGTRRLYGRPDARRRAGWHPGREPHRSFARSPTGKSPVRCRLPANDDALPDRRFVFIDSRPPTTPTYLPSGVIVQAPTREFSFSGALNSWMTLSLGYVPKLQNRRCVLRILRNTGDPSALIPKLPSPSTPMVRS